MEKFIYAIVSAVMLVGGTQHALAADLVETAATSGGTKTFVAALKASGVNESLKGNGPYTVFAPEDSAFEKLPPATKEALMKDKAKLAQVLSHHVVPGKILVADVKPGKIQTVEGGALTIKSDNGKVTVDDANVTQSDVTADNGVIHVIDSVVLPKE